MTAYKVGDKVKATIEGTVIALDDHAACVHIRDAGYSNHWIFAAGFGAKIEVTKPAEPEFADGVYQDNDGELIIRRDGKWLYPNGGDAYTMSARQKTRIKSVGPLPFGSYAY